MTRLRSAGLIALLLISCRQTEPVTTSPRRDPMPPPSPAAAAVPLEGTRWELVSIGDEKVSGRISLRFDAGSAGGYSGCNWYGGRVETQAGTLRFADVSSTARGCLEPLSSQEMRYHAALRSGSRYSATPDRLVLTPAGGSQLVFRRRHRSDVTPETLHGTSWRLKAIDALQTGTDAPTLRFERGIVSGYAGCRNYTGTWSGSGDEIGLTSLTMTSMECPGGRELLELEQEFTTHISETEYFVLRDGTLELHTAPGRTLVFAPL